MNFRRFQGWALIVSGVIDLLSLIRSDSTFFRVLLLVGTVLLIVGVPAIESVQRSGTPGLIGIILIELGAILALVLNFMALGGSADLGAALPLTSALAGAIGRVIVGLVTVQKKVFAPWIGWAFIIEGLVNLVGGVFAVPLLSATAGVVVPIVGAAALLGYGWGIVSRS
jgi:hypothetical protein